MSDEVSKQFEDKVVILGETADDYCKDTRKLDFLMERLSSQPSSEVIDLTTRKSGLDFLMEYDDMIRSFRRNGVEWTLEHNELAHKFCKRGLVDGTEK